MNSNSEHIEKAILAEKIIKEKVDSALNGVNANRRWFWELLQNAKDTVTYNPAKPISPYNKPNRRVAVNLYFYKDPNTHHHCVRFEHSGNPFRDNPDPMRFDDVKNLILPVSGKESIGVTTGKFGTGFLSTHILSLKVDVSGVFEKNGQHSFFAITLDRTQVEREERINNIAQSLAQYKKSFITLPSYIPNISNFSTTSFSYDLTFNHKGEEQGIKIVREALIEIAHIMPLVLNFVPEIESVTIYDSVNGKLISEYNSHSNTRKTNEIETIPVIKNYYKTTSDNWRAKGQKIGHSSISIIERLSNGRVEIAIPKYSNKQLSGIDDHQATYKAFTGYEFPNYLFIISINW